MSLPKVRLPSLILPAPGTDRPSGRFSLASNFIRGSGLINERRRFAYLQAPKAACSTVVWRLWTALHDAGDTPSRPDRSRIHEPHLPIWSRDYALLNEDGYFRFAIVRNPYARVLSAYLNKIKHHPENGNRKRFLSLTGRSASDTVSFLEFLRHLADPKLAAADRHWMPLCRVTFFDFVDLHFVGHVESFDTDMPVVMKRIFGEGLAAKEVDHRTHRTDAGEKISEYFGLEERELVQNIYRRDFKLFGYSLDPEQIAPVRPVKLEASGRLRDDNAWRAQLAEASRVAEAATRSRAGRDKAAEATAPNP